jgi:hypothetical protein
MNVFPADARLAFTSSFIATVLVSILAVAATAAIFLSPLSLLTLFFVLGALGLLVIAAWLGYQTYQLRDVSYSLDRNALVVRWGTIVEVVPTADIREVAEGSEIASELRLWRLPLPGCWFGEGRHATLGSVRAYATEPPERQLLIVTPRRSYLLSPNDLEGFLEALQTRLEMGPTRLVAPSRTLPSFTRWRIWRDKLAQVLLALGWALNLIVFAIALARYPNLPAQIPLHFDASGLPDRVGNKQQLFTPVSFGLAMLLISTVSGFVIYNSTEDNVQEGQTPAPLAAYMLWGGSVAVQVLFLLAILTLT